MNNTVSIYILYNTVIKAAFLVLQYALFNLKAGHNISVTCDFILLEEGRDFMSNDSLARTTVYR